MSSVVSTRSKDSIQMFQRTLQLKKTIKKSGQEKYIS